MASLRFFPLLMTASAMVFVHLLCFFTPTVVSQSPISPTIAMCSTSLLPLASCGPFVQGTAENPSQSCCDNLQVLNAQQPECLCLLLNDSAISRTFPINRTLALQLPSLCNLPMKTSTCLGSLAPSTPAATSPSPASLEANTNASIAASPGAHAERWPEVGKRRSLNHCSGIVGDGSDLARRICAIFISIVGLYEVIL